MTLSACFHVQAHADVTSIDFKLGGFLAENRRSQRGPCRVRAFVRLLNVSKKLVVVGAKCAELQGPLPNSWHIITSTLHAEGGAFISATKLILREKRKHVRKVKLPIRLYSIPATRPHSHTNNTLSLLRTSMYTDILWAVIQERHHR